MKKLTADTIWFTILATLFHQSGYLMFFFLVPLQVIRNRRDFGTFLTSSAVVLSAVLVMVIVRTGGMEDSSTRAVLILSEVLVPAYLLAGFIYINYDWPGNPRMLKRMVVVTVAALFAGIPVLLFFNNHLLQQYFREQIIFALDVIKTTLGEADSLEAGDMAEIIASVTPELVSETMKRTTLKTYLFFYFMILSGSWWLGSSGIRNGRWRSAFNPSKFSLPEYLVWPLIISLLVVVVDNKMSAGVLGYTGWNILLIMVTLYGFKGLGIIQNFMKIHKIPYPMRMLLIFTISLLLLQPGLNYFILIGIPLLGVSEIWIKYRKI
jgi:hypothetical protein